MFVTATFVLYFNQYPWKTDNDRQEFFDTDYYHITRLKAVSFFVLMRNLDWNFVFFNTIGFRLS